MTKLEICNHALAIIGHDRTIAAYDEQTAEGKRCRDFYPAALKNVIGAYNWEFAIVETSVQLNQSVKEWSIPAELVKLVAVHDERGRALRATRKGDKLNIYREGEDEIQVAVKYTSTAGENFEAALPHLVAEAVAYELASLLFAPMTGNVQDSQGRALFESYIAQAGAKLQAAITAEEAENAFMGGSRIDAAKTEIANRALARLGADTVVKDFATDTSPIAARSRLMFRAALAEAIRSRDWDFAAREVAVALSWDNQAGFSRLHLPHDCIKIVQAMDENRNPLNCYRDRDSFYVKSAGAKTIIRYLSCDIDLAETPEYFRDLVALALAVKLAPSALKNASEVAAITQQLEAEFSGENFREANETAAPGEWKNPLVACRQ